MESPYRIKQLTESDLSLLKELLSVFGKAFGEIHTYTAAVPSDAYLQALLRKTHFLALVALANDAVIGGLAAYELEKFEQDRREIYIYDLAVDERHRRKRVATQLINELRRVARHRKAYVIFVQADRGDEPAIRLYESLGTREEVLHFNITVL